MVMFPERGPRFVQQESDWRDIKFFNKSAVITLGCANNNVLKWLTGIFTGLFMRRHICLDECNKRYEALFARAFSSECAWQPDITW